MSAERNDEPVLRTTDIVGEISVDGVTAPLRFTVSAGADCRLRIATDLVDAPTYFLAIRALSKRGAGNEEFSPSGTSVDGKCTVVSETVCVRGFNHNDARRWITLGSRACKVTINLEAAVQKPVLRLWFRSFMSFSNPAIETSLGRLAVSGKAENVAANDVVTAAVILTQVAE
jgi:hypothetical protein